VAQSAQTSSGGGDQGTICFSFCMIERTRTLVLSYCYNHLTLACEMKTTWFNSPWVLIGLIGFPLCSSAIVMVLQL
jgi:hypothetical protein